MTAFRRLVLFKTLHDNTPFNKSRKSTKDLNLKTFYLVITCTSWSRYNDSFSSVSPLSRHFTAKLRTRRSVNEQSMSSRAISGEMVGHLSSSS